MPYRCSCYLIIKEVSHLLGFARYYNDLDFDIENFSSSFLSMQCLSLLPLWLSFATSLVLTILLWSNIFDITRDTLNDTVQTSTTLLRFVNLVLTVEIFLLVSTLYGVFVWYVIQKQKDGKTKLAPESFYDGGKSLFPTLNALLNSKHVSIRILSLWTIIFMILGYILDIFYTGSVSYSNIENCQIRDTQIDIMPSSLSSISTVQPSSLMYSFGSRVSQLPYIVMPYTNSYIVPAINNTNGLQNYTTIQFHVNVQCQNPPKRIVNRTTTNDEYQALSSNGSYIWLKEVSGLNQMVIDPGYSNGNYTEIFISVGGFQDTNPIGLDTIKYGNYNVSTARCQTSITYDLMNDVYNWDHDSSFTSAADIAMLAQRAALDTYTAFWATSTKTIHNSISEWLADSVYDESLAYDDLSSRVNISVYEERLTMIAIEYLKGSGTNGSMVTPGMYCIGAFVKANIAVWYKAIFTVVQVISVAVILLVTLRSSKTDLIHNDTSTLIRYIQNNFNK